MAELRLGERVTVNGRAFEITGFTSMSVKPRCAFLKDPSTNEVVALSIEDLAFEQLRYPPDPSSKDA